MQWQYNFAPVLLNFLGNTPCCPKSSTPLFLPPISRENFWLAEHLVSPCHTGTINIYKHPSLLRNSNPVPSARYSASLTTTSVSSSERALYQNSFGTFSRYENPVSGTVVTHVGAPVAWGPRIIDMSDTAVATPLLTTILSVRALIIKSRCDGVLIPLD
ncbi:hypothetical protein TNCV_4836401 [Trichonephila clavipes]|nr:hypothetical protein TNCV_4836401 [Trichonephila clavipes]